jgi:mono/diheme cytochrome c family protein
MLGRKVFVCGVSVILGLAFASSAAPDSAEEAAQKILARNCYGCHGETRMSGLDLREISSILKGGKRGPAVVPGHSAESLLYKAVSGTGDLKMPPGKATVTADDVRTIAAWIDGGAKWPDSTSGSVTESTWWAFRKPQRPAVPAVKNVGWVRSPVDSFILAKLEGQQLTPAPPADKLTLVRRVYFDLTGLPPIPEEVQGFLADQTPSAYEKLVDKLLASPRYGERWGRHWLDVVRYADTSGFESDLYLRHAWRYRDYVIAAFNQDKPYDEFVKEQIAADEIWPNDNELEGTYILAKQKEIDIQRRVGTGMYTVGPFDPSSALDGAQLRYDRLTDMADTTASAFLGLSMGCARCHDHKFDPITQKDYYRLQAIFSGSQEKEIPIVDAVKIITWRKSEPKQLELDNLRDEVARLDASVGRRVGKRKPASGDYSPEDQQRRDRLMRQIAEMYVALPKPYAVASVLGHSDDVPDIHIAIRGDFRNPGERVGPGFPAVLAKGAEIRESEDRPFIPQRRKALALWLTQPDHPLTARVMVNRIWQWHFGTGIVATPNDFGRQGDAPSNPELLDWLATEFISRGWSIKAMQRLILLSNTYRMSDRYDAANAKIDPADRDLWRFPRLRLDAEEVRDATLAVSGSLNLKAGGPPVIPPLQPDEVSALGEESLWPATLNPAEPLRRSVYMYVKRMFRLPMLETFDAPDNSFSCARREATTVAPQALTLMNSRFVFERAKEFAARLTKKDGDNPGAWVEDGWQLALARTPTVEEKRKALEMFDGKSSEPRSRALVEFCLMLFNLNEFIYVD